MWYNEEPDGLFFGGVAYIEGPPAPLTGLGGLLKAEEKKSATAFEPSDGQTDHSRMSLEDD